MGLNAPVTRTTYLQDLGPRWSGRRWRDRDGWEPYERDLSPQRVTLRRPFIFALIVHLLAAAPFVFVFRFHPTPPVPPHETVVHLVSLPQMRPGRLTRERPAPPRTPPNPLVRTRTYKRPDLAKAAPKPMPEEPAKEPPAKPQPDRPKVGAADTTSMVRTSLPAVGNLKGAMGLWAEGEALPYSYYFEVLQRKIAAEWEPPGVLGRTSDEVGAVLWFRIERDGRVLSRYVEEPSGSNVFDSSALRALDRATPFPPLPMDFPDDHLIIHLRFVYSP